MVQVQGSRCDVTIQPQDLVGVAIVLGRLRRAFGTLMRVVSRMHGPLPLAVRLQSQRVGARQQRVHELSARDCALTERAPLEVSLNLSHNVGVSLCRGPPPTRSRGARDLAKSTLGRSQMSS